ncbi:MULTISPECIES: ribosomal protection-like ABC-F family protein [Streptomyces]|uniref:ABC transporter ATP-binding protein n=1 Tax=Streptomyces albidoflavus TaxID=1886 RepID=A0AA37BZR5_9ACTN|nr:MULTISPECIES: ABC-F family ATP-binding cassette domain-containing protein [Streptomyces]MCO6696307.1 ATP-binding cassette domain-containing protein [Streptomyces sp. Vc17.3-30]RZE52536.1 ABC transporter ATP-binding protein [Streptomyces albidoflavus]WQG73216.1 ABC-F family ATP-binding cassette domain-containing protein [Streptomyces albidoflavus]WST09893.1 ATP-binding cassette domain-containing protein [Streptomyces albidoflavus]GHI47831.1 ABC transporter ATP-binding protein [Streptomyces a
MPSRTHAPTSPARSAQLALKDVSKAYGERAVLDQVSLTVRPGERAGVIGENGSGKSTLLKLIAGAETPDSGEVTVVAPGGTGHLRQTLDLPPHLTVQDAVDDALADLRELESRLQAAGERLGEAGDRELAEYGELLAAFEARDGYQADTRVETALHHLGLGHLGRDRSLGSLSGGEQSRLALACVLAAAPELLLLDEPTNHLDDRSTDWLADRLRAHRGTLVTVTHDRAFLERVTTTILEVDRDTRAVTRYGDGWPGYRRAKAAARRRWAQEHEEYVAELARTEELVAAAGQRLAATGRDPGEGFGKHRRSSENKLSAQVRAARERLTRLHASPVPPPPEPLSFRATLTPHTDPAGGTPETATPLLTLTGVRVADRLHVDALQVEPGGRLLVTGPNGAGKTTLLRVVSGALRPDAGTVARSPGTRIAHLAQELAVDPAPVPLLTAYAAGRPGHPDAYAAELLEIGLFREDDLTVPVPSLSAGQRRRLSLARLVSRPADLLVLDEPANHLSLTLVEEIEEALEAYAGAVVVVSHDRRFRERFSGRRLELAGGRVTASSG